MPAQICVGEPGKVQWEVWRGLYSDQFSELMALEFFPSRPDLTQTLYSLNAPINYDNNFGAKISGFIKVPVSDSVTFNITGNSKAEFYLSPSQLPSQMVLRAFANDWTNEFEHTKFVSQTSQKLWLVQGQYYYFEIRYVESTGGDHCKVFWKNSFVSNSTWNIISAAYIHDIGCKSAPCPVRGTPCNDSNPNTIDDLSDGHCNCVGKPNTANNCVGARNTIQRYRYDNSSGSTINDLYLNPNFPAIPTTSAQLPLLGVKSESQINNSGDLVQGYLSVPVSGNYKFNVTGDDMTILFISSDHSPENKQAHQVLVSDWTNPTEHNKFIYQSTSNIYLQAGRFYYVELNHKEGSGSEHFGAFWQTPFTAPGTWKRIPSFYFYDYGCDIACIPAGTPCDDGNPFTKSDIYNSNCTCVGIPCSGPDCDSPLASYVPYEKCGLTDQIDNQPANNWLSCQPSNNPNPALPRNHWIKYDLGQRHKILTSQVWNYNVMNQAQQGFQNVRIDYSENNTSWQHLGNYTWPLANGNSGYGGFVGPNFSGTYARYILISSNGDTTSCKGIGKVAFKAILCPTAGTPCNDSNSLTINDAYDGNCNCAGQSLLANECDNSNLYLGNIALNSNVYSAINHVTSISHINPQDTVGIVGGKSVIMNPGFETIGDVIFIASIDTCATGGQQILARANTQSQQIKQDVESLTVIPEENSDFVDIHYVITKPGKVLLKIVDNDQKHILADYEHLNNGHYIKRIRTKKISNSSAYVMMVTSENSIREMLKSDY